MTTMVSYENDWTIFFMRPVSAVLAAMSILALVYPLYRHLRTKRFARLSAAG